MQLNNINPIDEPITTNHAVINGNIVYYDVCSVIPYFYNPSKFTYIGYGIIYSINGHEQKENKRYYFYTAI